MLRLFGRKKLMKEKTNTIVRNDSVTVQLSKEERHELDEYEEKNIVAASHIGTREYQQDSYYISSVNEDYQYGVLCDGMGGMEDGDKVSSDVVEYFVNKMEHLDKDVDFPYFFEKEIHLVNDYILSRYEHRGHGVGTTFISVAMQGNHLYWAAVGDSRIYIIRGNEIVQMTRDHNYAMELREMVERGTITEDEAVNNPQKDALISYIGAPYLSFIDVSRGPFLLLENDIVLLCSDGLTKALDNEQIFKIIQRSIINLERAVNELIKTSLEDGAGSKDNITIILMKYKKINNKKECLS